MFLKINPIVSKIKARKASQQRTFRISQLDALRNIISAKNID